MKKSLLALAVLGAFAGAASAQSSVTIYGSFDGGIRNLSNVNAAGDDRLTMGSNGTYNSNRIGFKGVEDLGGGLNAHFNLETGFNSGTGAFDTAANTLFNRTASVGIGGAFGSVDLGRQYTVAFKTIGAYDPFNYKYTGIIPLATQGGLTRLNNDIQYTGTFGAITARAEYALGEVAGSTGNGAAKAIGATYDDGALTIGGAYTDRKTVTGLNDDNWTAGAAYKFGAFRVSGGYARNETQVIGAADNDTNNAWVGASFDITPALALTAGYYQTKYESGSTETGKRKLAIIGATYALSKRTNFYADIDNARYSGNAAGNGPSQAAGVAGQTRQTGISVGINHLF